MSKLDELLSQMKVEEYGITPQHETKKQIKTLILDLFKEVNYDPFEFVDRVSKL